MNTDCGLAEQIINLLLYSFAVQGHPWLLLFVTMYIFSSEALEFVLRYSLYADANNSILW